jgi:two-component system, OmpR family, sensor histidine kinase RstB
MKRLIARFAVSLLLSLAGAAVVAALLVYNGIARNFEQSFDRVYHHSQTHIVDTLAGEGDRVELLAELESDLGMKVEVFPIEGQPAEARLLRGEMVSERYWRQSYVLIPVNEQEVARVGPLFTLVFDQGGRSLLLTGLLLLALSIPLVVVFRPLAQQLQELSRTATELGQGDFKARARVVRNDALGDLAHRVNDMAEQIQRLIDGQNHMLRAVSHDLRTPLARIRFSLELVLDEEDPKQRKERAHQVDRDLQQLDGLIGALLTWSRLSTAPTASLTKVLLDDLLQQAVDDAELLLPGEISISLDVTDGQSVTVDRKMVRRAVDNLLSNASRHAASQIHVTGWVDGDTIHVRVDDDGDGVPAADHHRVFEPFVCGKGGIGLGLAIVAHVAHLHGGQAVVADRPGGGARFELTLSSARLS